jgi:myo-inositol-hexaphosphate 3-phosphohydrolase
VSPVLETARTTQIPPDADDPSFWHNDADPLKSLVIATQKEAGYSIYDVNGATLADVKPGDIRYNNVDIIYGFTLGGNTVDLAVFTDRMYDRFAIYTISAEAPYLTDVTDAASPALFGGDPGDDTAYGLAVYESPSTGKFYAFATQAGTWFVKQFELAETGGKIGWTLVRTISLEAGDDDEQAEGMVVDQEYGIAYICQEEGGVYKVTAEPAGDIALGEDDMLAEEGDYNLVEDIEGVGMYYKSDGTGYVIVSSQGSNTFGVFDRVSGDFINSFSVIDNGEGVDGSQDCDGLDIMNMPFGTLFPSGIIIVQDGQDYNHDTNDYSTNFKWIKWDDVAAELGLDTDTAYDPRNPVNRID